MATSIEPTQSSRPLRNGGVWIEGKLAPPPPGVTGPLVFGPDWLLEMLRSETRGTVGFFWAPFAIIRNFPNLDAMLNARFVGFSLPSDPPAAWLTTSMMFDLGTAPLANTPEQFIDYLGSPRPFMPLEGTERISALSQQAKRIIASNYRSRLSIREVACKLDVSHAHLSRQFRRDFGLTPINYLHRLRVSEAIGRLSQGEEPLEVGYEVGFSDTSRFYRDFVKVTGTSPGKCRKSFE